MEKYKLSMCRGTAPWIGPPAFSECYSVSEKWGLSSWSLVLAPPMVPNASHTVLKHTLTLQHFSLPGAFICQGNQYISLHTKVCRSGAVKSRSIYNYSCAVNCPGGLGARSVAQRAWSQSHQEGEQVLQTACPPRAGL